jgi:hypothetical protein
MAQGYYSLLGRAPSLFDIMQAAGQSYAQGRQLAMQRDSMKRQDAREARLQQIQEADALRQDARLELDTRRWFEEQNLKREAAKAEQQAVSDKSAANVKRWAAQAIDARPESAPQVMEMLRRRGVEFDDPAMSVQLPDEPPIQALPESFDPRATAASLQGDAAGILGAPRPEDIDKPKITNDMVEFMAISGLKPGDPAFGQQFDRWLTKMTKSRATSVNVGVDTGRQEAVQAVKSEQQKELINTMNTTSMLDELEAMATPEGAAKPNWAQFLGGGAQTKGAIVNKLDKWAPSLVGSGDRAQVERLNEFRAVLDKYRSEEYKRLLGSAQSEAEIKNLVNAIISADMSPAQFGEAFKTLRRATARAEGIAKQVLGEGFEVGSPEYRKRYSELEAGAKKGSAKAPPNARQRLAADLKAGRISQEIYDAALSEMEGQ